MDEVLRQQSSRTQADCDRAVFEEGESFGSLFGPPYGPLNPEEVALLTDAFEHLADKVDAVVQAEKKNWARLRPYLEDARVVPCVRKETTFSYPSGHATVSEFEAEVLAHIFTQHDPRFYVARAHQVGDDRVLGGMHHPTDILAGQVLGHELFAEWSEDPQFVAEIARLRKLVETNACKSP